MALIINNNMMAMTAARNLGVSYDALAVSTARLSSGLRINTAADDAAGLAVRESMRADIAVLNQGVRNAGDAISLIQTAEGALQVIDEKLIRMKELAEQAATGTYTTTQRAIMDSEYQAMAAEIDRISNASDFNGVKLLDGSITETNSSGMKIHFGTGNESAEDYYYINIGDMRATETTGLRVGGGANAEVITATTGFATAGATSIGVGYFAYYYDQSADQSGTNVEIADLAGFYQVTSGANYLNDMINQINLGTAARGWATALAASAVATAHGDVVTIIGTQNLVLNSNSAGGASYAGNSFIRLQVSVVSGYTAAQWQGAIISAINNDANAAAWAISGTSAAGIFFIARTAGVTGNNVAFSNPEADLLTISAGVTSLSSGGQTWATASANLNTSTNEYHLRLTGATAGDNYDINIVEPSSLDPGLTDLVDGGAGEWADLNADFTENTDASGSGDWNGADILTQSAAQLALAQIADAIDTKDNARASLGATANRLENTITNLVVQAENLQAAESRVSDVDVASEMTEFTKNSILVQAATAMLAQANSLPQLALQLLGG